MAAAAPSGDVDPQTGVARTDEHKWYAKLFALADADRDGHVSGAEAAAFLRKTGLTDAQLAQVWDCVDTEKSGALGPREFAQAMRVVAGVQQGLPIALSSMAKVTELARFPKDPSVPRAPARPQKSGSSEPSSSSSGTVSLLVISDREKYDRLFADADSDRDGFVSGAEAKAYFSKANLESQVLAKVWSLSERDGDRRLSTAEFRVAMHLVYYALKGGVLPDSLPDSFYASAQVGLPQPAPPTASAASPFGPVGPAGSSSAVPAYQQQQSLLQSRSDQSLFQPSYSQAPAAAPPSGFGASSPAFGGGIFAAGLPTGLGAPQGFKKPTERGAVAGSAASSSSFGGTGAGFGATPSFVPAGQQPSFGGGNFSNAHTQQSHLVAQHSLPGMSFEGRAELQGAISSAAQRRGNQGF